MTELYQKYQVTKKDGSPTDPDAQYFVLRIDTDPAARVALMLYAEAIHDQSPEFAQQLRDWIDVYR